MAKIIICDIDGTIADKSHRAGVKRPTHCQVMGDKPIQHVLDVVKALQHSGYSIVFSSSRHTDLFADTRHWLASQGFNDPNLHVRPPGDKSPDEVIKERTLKTLPLHEVVLVIDDKKVCVDMYRAAGLTVFHCKPPTT